MNERGIKTKFIKWFKKLPQVYYYCPADRFYSGIPDIIFCIAGRFGWIEFKTPRGKVTEIQAWTHDQLEKSGAVGKVCRSAEEAIDFICNTFNTDY